MRKFFRWTAKMTALLLSVVMAISAQTAFADCDSVPNTSYPEYQSAAAESLAEIVQAGLPNEVIPAETPTADCVSFECSYSYEGVAVTCADIEALKENGLNGVPVDWSDGIWPTYWHPSETGFLLQPIEGLAKEFGNYMKYEGGIPSGAEDMTFTLPEKYTNLDEPVYVLYVLRTDADRLEAALAADSNVTVLGVLFCGLLDPMVYSGAGFRVVAEDGVNLTPEFFGESVPYARFETDENAWYVGSGDENTSFDEALVIQEQIAAMDGIKSVCMLGTCVDSLRNPAAATARIVPFTPKAPAGDMESTGLSEIITATEAGKLHEVYPVANPTPECVSYLLEGYSYEGVAITCADIDVLKENGLNGVPVEWSDGIWSSYWQPSGTEFLIQPLEGLSKEFGFYGKYEHFGDEVQDDGKENSFPIPAECTGLDEPIYVLYTPKADAARLEAVLASDRSVTVIGALFCGILQPVNEKGDILDVMPYRAAATTAKIVSFTPKAMMGDVDGDGQITAYDATLALTAFSEKTAGYAEGERSLTPAQEQIADVDGDGELTAFDATMILTYFNLKYNTGYDDLTWADVLPET